MPLVFRTLRARVAALVLISTSTWLFGCAASKESYAPEAPPSYYGGGAAPVAQAMPDAAPGAMPSMPAPPPPAPMSAGRAESYEAESMDSGGDSDSGFFGGAADEAPKMAQATPLSAPVAPAARAPIAAPPSRPAPPPAAGNKGGPQAPGQNGKKPEAAQGEQQPEKTVTPLLIYTGGLGMEIAEATAIPTTIDKIIDTAESLGGYLASRSDTSVVVRVPSRNFRAALTAFEKLGEVKRRNVSAEDVSEEFHDLEVRLANLKSVQKRLQEFLARAANVNDALTVERELERVGREIDQIEGRMRFLRARATFSTITVDLSAKPKPQIVANGTPLPPPPRTIDLPIDWLSRVGLEALLNLR